MKFSQPEQWTPLLTLCAATAEDLMAHDPVWIRPDATVKEAAAFLAANRVGAVPVLDEIRRPVGVLSQSDILQHSREMVEFLSEIPNERTKCDLEAASSKNFPGGLRVVDVDRTLVRDVMTPAVFSVTPETPAAKVIDDMVTRKVHRLFVVSEDGTLVGTISAFDVVRHLHAALTATSLPHGGASRRK